MSDAITRLDHVAFAVPEVARVVPLVVGELGGRERGAGPGAGFRFWQWEFEGGGALEILEPDGPADGFLHRFLAARGAGPHHLTFKVRDLRDAMRRARDLGHDVVGVNESQPSWREAFLHPKRAQGIVVQLVEHHPERDGDWQPPPFPPSPAPAPAVSLLGLRVAARSEARARAQWQELLGGACEASGRDLVFRWPDSPLRVSVTVDPGAAEGPLALEVSADRELPLPEGPHPALGLPIVCVGVRR